MREGTKEENDNREAERKRKGKRRKLKKWRKGE